MALMQRHFKTGLGRTWWQWRALADRRAGLLADDYEEPTEDPDTPPVGEPDPPVDTPEDPDTEEPEPGVDPDFAHPTRIEVTGQKQTVIRTDADPNTWGNAYIATPAEGYDYWEIHIAQSTPKNATLAVGITNLDLPLNGIPGDLEGTLAYWSSGVTRTNGTDTAGRPTYKRGDKIMIARDKDTGNVWFGLNGTWIDETPAVGGDGHQGTLTGDDPYYPFVSLYSTGAQASFKFTASKFDYAVPTDFFPLGQTPVSEGVHYYAFATKTTPVGLTSGVMTLQTDISDVDGVHDTGSNTSRFTVPAAWDGRYGYFSGGYISQASGHGIQLYRGGAGYEGAGLQYESHHASLPASGPYVCGAVLPLTAGQYFEVFTSHGTNATISTTPSTWAQLVSYAEFSGALVRKNANQTIAGATNTLVTFQTEIYDTDGYFDTATSATKLNVPVGVDLVRVTGNVNFNDYQTSCIVTILKGGSHIVGLPSTNGYSQAASRQNVVSAPMAVSSGNYFEMRFMSSFGSFPLLNDNYNWFQIEKLPADLNYAILKKSSTQATSATTNTLVTWASAEVDVGGWFSAGDPTKLTVPSGVTHVRLVANIGFSAATDARAIFKKNGSTTFDGNAPRAIVAWAPSTAHLKSAILPVIAGDYFELEVYTIAAATQVSSTLSWFSIEEVRVA